MAAAGGRVFISYSRRDYYFAESLTLRLRERGVTAWMDVLELQPGASWEAALHAAIDDCAAFVLVASPAALESEPVRREWQRALAQGRRVLLLGWQQRVHLPAELQGCEWLDLRGRFRPAVARLVQRLASPDADRRPAGPKPGRLPKLPPEVLIVLMALLLPIVVYTWATAPDASLVRPEDIMPGLGYMGTALLYGLLTLGFVWWLSFSLLQRRMGMTRLMLSLAAVAAPFMLTGWKVLRHGAAGVADMHGEVGRRVLEHLPWVWLLTALPLLTMAWILLVRPLGLLHWMPIGKAWERMRRPGRELAPSAATPAQALAAVRDYRLLYDPADAPLADSLRKLLARQGSAERADPAAQPMLLLSNRSEREWLARQEAVSADPSLLLVVGSAIGLPASFGWLWSRQWIDLRRGALPPQSTAALLPMLPEAVTQLRLPVPVARLHALLCALGVLLVLLGHLLTPAAVSASEDASLQLLAGALIGGLLVWCARRLLHREQAAPSLRRWLARLLSAGCLFVLLLLLPWTGLASEPRVAGLVGAVAAFGLGWACWRALPQVQAWLPQALPLPPKQRRLVPPSDWRTSLVVTACMFAWLLPVQLFAPDLMQTT